MDNSNTDAEDSNTDSEEEELPILTELQYASQAAGSAVRSSTAA